MKNAKNLVIAILLLFLLCSSSFILHNNVENNASNSIIQEINSPEVSNPNKSLLHTYDFEDETIGQDPTYQTLSVNEATGCTANIETLADGQQKHLSLHKVGSTGRVWVRDNFSRFGETYTAGEYHLKVYHDASGFGINLNSANMEAILAMVWWNGEIRDDVGGTLLATYAYNQWLDVVIYFNLSLGWMFDLEGVRYGAGYSYSFFGPFTANAEHIWITSFVSGGGDGYFRVDDISFYYETENLINIFTPESKEYRKPMDGYYPSTYGFENDADGTSPEGWINQDWSSCTSEIISELGGHKKVLRQTDNSNGYGAVVNRTFASAQDHGTVEFYARVSLITPGTRMWLDLNSASGQEIWLIMDDSGIKFWDGGPWYDIIPSGIKANTWYHFSIRWRNTGASSYEALGEGEWKIFIDGVEYGNYDLVYDDIMNSVNLESGASPFGHITYWDAIGFDWDPNYNIGDNLYEGLLLSFKNSTALDWIGYSLDGQLNKTILGNTTIPMPEDGLHSIQVFGNDSLGDMYQSDIRHFTVDFPIDIITPEAKIYEKGMSGYYPATYGFENDRPGESPDDWILNVMDGSSFVAVDSNLDGHNNVVEIRKDGGINSAGMSNNFDLNVSIGAVEFWLYKDTDSGTDATFFSVVSTENFNGNAQGVIMDGDFYYMTSDFGSRILVASDIFSINTWHHVSLEFNISIGWQITIDDILYGQNYAFPFRGSVTGNQMKSFFVQSLFSGGASNYGSWVDSVGYSWDPCYTIRDNLYEGLLISYKNSTSLEWQGYSLDGQPINTIMGNNTIPLPNDGEHTIQIFANNSLGTKYLSDIRNFAISRTIQIITPENKVYTEPMSGYYPATFGFEETITGILPSYCDYAPGGSSPDGPGSYAKVIDNWTDGAGNTHKKVLKTYDRTSSSTTHASLYFTDEGSENYRNSTIEFWACNTLTGSYYHSYFEIWGDLGNMVSFEWDSGGTTNDPEVRITPATGEFGTGVYHEWNRWYRYSIDISCDGGYAGLGTNQFRFRIYNETGDLIYSSADLDLLTAHPTGGPYRYHVLSTESQSDVSHYLDGFGITGLQDNYNISDNFEEGLLLSYENSTSLDWQGYSLDGQPINFIMGNIAIPLPDVGQHTIQVFGEDLLGKMHKSDIRYFMVDTTQVVDILAPSITINSPENNTFWNSAPFLDITAIDPNLDTIWYSVNNVNITLQNNTLQQLNISIWNTLPEEGEFVIYIYANDSTGNLNDEYMLRLHKDVKNPAVIINNPNPSDLFGDLSPTFDISISEPNLNQTWYTLIGGSLNHFFSGSSGTIDQTSWEEFGNGTVTIRFYANDTLNNLGFSEVTVRKDTIEPQITINNPIQDQVFYDTAPSFDLTIIEGNLDSIWYTLDDGITYFPCDISGIFNNLYWNAIPPGYYTLKFYANDTLGNLGFSEVIIEKKEPVIPGYNPLLVSLIIVVGIMGISLKIKKKSK